jgi:hypothetical protein
MRQGHARESLLASRERIPTGLLHGSLGALFTVTVRHLSRETGRKTLKSMVFFADIKFVRVRIS